MVPLVLNTLLGFCSFFSHNFQPQLSCSHSVASRLLGVFSTHYVCCTKILILLILKLHSIFFVICLFVPYTVNMKSCAMISGRHNLATLMMKHFLKAMDSCPNEALCHSYSDRVFILQNEIFSLIAIFYKNFMKLSHHLSFSSEKLIQAVILVILYTPCFLNKTIAIVFTFYLRVCISLWHDIEILLLGDWNIFFITRKLHNQLLV